ncbi:MAG: prolyl oligopeptidase family serine peptidase, partial [Acidobacteriota bacterium]
LDLAGLRIADLSEDGRWLAVTSATLRDRIGVDNYRYGDPTYIAPSLSDVWVIETQTQEARRLFPQKVQVQSLKWSRNGEYLAFLLLRDGLYRPMIWERRGGRVHPVTLPADRHAATNSELEWAPAGDRLFLSLRPADWQEKASRSFQQETQGPIVFHSSQEPFLAWDEMRRMSQPRIVAAYETATGQTREVIPERRINSYHFDRDAGVIAYYEDITQKTDYDVIGGATSKVQVQSLGGGEARTILESTKDRRIIWSRNGRHYAYAEKGDLYFGSVDDAKPRQLTGKREAAEEKPPEAGDRKPGDESKPEEKETYSPVRLSPEGKWLVASNKKGFWLIQTADGAKELFIERDEEDTEAPRYDLIDWDPTGERVYFSRSSRQQWERGVVRYLVGAKKMEELLSDGRGYANFTLSLDGSTFVFLRSENNRPADLYVADSDFQSVRRLMEGNPQLAGKRLPKAELVSYLNTDGKKLHGVLYYPADYVEGRKYPTVFNIYEDFFDDRFNGTICLLNAHGYAVMQPSVTFQTGFPGEAWLKSVTCAANKLIEIGIADPERLGVHGTSYGGYATNLLITQTDRFKAAINISGKVNMVSFYTDSPRLGVRNIHAPEKSQDRIGATLWQQPQKYIEHSAVMFADRIKTPLLLMTGEQDANVPARQAMEMYYALRRLDKEVAWVQYINGGHGMPTTTVEEVKDYHRRILEWYDSHLKGDLKKKDKTGTENR